MRPLRVANIAPTGTNRPEAPTCDLKAVAILPTVFRGSLSGCRSGEKSARFAVDSTDFVADLLAALVPGFKTPIVD